jgi:hypothetical protein
VAPLPPGSLKLVTWQAGRPLGGAVERVLRERAGGEHARPLHAGAALVYTDAGPDAVREWLAPLLAEGESLIVVEFERWSAVGPEIDRDWLLRRGH